MTRFKGIETYCVRKNGEKKELILEHVNQQPTNAEMALDELKRGKRRLSKKRISYILKKGRNLKFLDDVLPEHVLSILKKHKLTMAQCKWVLKSMDIK